MKKTIPISIGKTLFHIEEDAYGKLSQYLVAVKLKFSSNPEGSEIVADIENRIAEHFLDGQKGDVSHVVDLGEVESLISSMGRPDDFVSPESETDKEDSSASANPAPTTSANNKKLYRNPDDMVLAGVASGLGSYLGIEPVLVRLAFALFAFLNGFGVIVYLVLWASMKEAKTATEKLQMQGAPVTLESVDKLMKETTSNIKEKVGDKNSLSAFANSVGRGLASFLRHVIPGFGKIIGIVISIVAAIGVAALVLGMMAVFISLGSPYLDFPFLEAVGYPLFIFIVIAVFFAVLVPLLFVQALGSLLRNGWDNQKTKYGAILFGLWFVALLSLAALSARAIPVYREFVKNDSSYQKITRAYELEDFSSIKAQNGFSVEIFSGNEFKAEANGRERYLDNIELAVSQGILTISRKSENSPHVCIFCSTHSTNVRVWLPVLQSLSASNGVNVKGTANASGTISVRLENGSSVDLSIVGTSTQVLLRTENASRANISGSTEEADFSASNGSRIQAENLVAKKVRAHASNASKITLQAKEVLDATAENAGRIEYIGTPKELRQDVSNASVLERISGDAPPVVEKISTTTPPTPPALPVTMPSVDGRRPTPVVEDPALSM